MKRYSYSAPLALAIAASQFPAPALAFNPTEAALGFNIFTQNQLILRSGHTDGAVATGGNLHFYGTSHVGQQTAGAYPATKGTLTNISLAVQGDVIFHNSQYSGKNYNSNVNFGYARIGTPVAAKLLDKDNNNASVMLRITETNDYNSQPFVQHQFNGGAARQSAANAAQSPGIDFASKFTSLNTAATSLLNLASLSACSGKTAQVTIPNRPQPNQQDNPAVSLTAGKINILNLTTAQLDDLNTRGSVNISPSPSESTPLVINVSNGGAEFTYNWTMMSVGGLGPSTSPYIIWNFYNAKNLNINNEKVISGSILAPLANVTRTQGNNNIDGQVIAASFDIGYSGGEIHEQPFNVDLCSVPLPVTLVSFKATREGNFATLNWSTAMEKNSSHFVIEGSLNAAKFDVRGEVSAAGEKSNYQFRDNQELATGANYYRLKMVDLDGSFAYSKILSLRGDDRAEAQGFAYPNPSVRGQSVGIKTYRVSAATAIVSVQNASGVVVSRKNVNLVAGENPLQIQAPAQSGIYFVTIRANDGTSETIKIIVQ